MCHMGKQTLHLNTTSFCTQPKCLIFKIVAYMKRLIIQSMPAIHCSGTRQRWHFQLHNYCVAEEASHFPDKVFIPTVNLTKQTQNSLVIISVFTPRPPLDIRQTDGQTLMNSWTYGIQRQFLSMLTFMWWLGWYEMVFAEFRNPTI